MLLLTLLIFINSIFISRSDESDESKYIDSLPEKEKKEFLETVARRILEEVKSSEAVPGAVSGEIPEEQLKIHSDYVSRILKEETENLKRRKLTKVENKNDTILNTSIVDPLDETEKKIEGIEKAIEKVHNVDVHNHTESKLRTDLENENTFDGKSKVIDLTLREGKDNTPKVEKEQVKEDSLKQETVHSKDSRRADKDENKAIDLTIRQNDAQVSGKGQEEDKLRFNNNQTTVYSTEKVEHENLKVGDNSSKENSTEKLSTNGFESTTEKKYIKEPVSIEITIVNNDDSIDDSEKSKLDKKDEIPVQVIYDKNKEEKPKENIQDISTMKMSYSTTASTIHSTVNENNNQTEEPNTNKNIFKTFRRNNDPGVDDNVEKIGQVDDNQIARKKRKSNDTGSSEVGSELANAEVTNDNQENSTEADTSNNTTVEPSRNSNIASDTDDNITPKTSALNVLSVTNDTSFHIENTTNKDIKTSEVKAGATIVETLPSSVNKLEQTTDNIENQYTQIQDFDANENETTSDPDTTNYTGTTTEEIIKIKTQFISGYPEDSYENSTEIAKGNDTQIKNTTVNTYNKFEKSNTEEVIDIKTEFITGYPDDYERTTLKTNGNDTNIKYSTVNFDDKLNKSTTDDVIHIKTEFITGYPDDYERTTLKSDVNETHIKNTTVNVDDKFEQTSIEIYEPKGSQDMNASFYALKLSDKDVGGSSVATKDTSFSVDGRLNIKIDVSLTEPKKDSEDLNDAKTAKLRELTHVLADFIKHNKKDKTTKSNLDKEKYVAQNSKQQNLKSQAPVVKDSVNQYITSTTIVPLTTPEISEKKELYYLQEASAEIVNDSIVILKDHVDSKEKLKKSLRSHNNFVKGVRDEAKINKKRPAKKEYLVYEILPGQQQFVKKHSIKKLTKKLKPKEYPKLTKYYVSKQAKPLVSEQKSQIEPPNYAPVYNYAPEFAYYNPKNKYGLNFDDDVKKIVDDRSDNNNYAKKQPNYVPVYNYAPEFAYYNPHNKYSLNSDDEDQKIVDERSNEREFADIKKIFDYEMPKHEQNDAKNRQGARSDRPLVIHMQLNDKKPLKERGRISEDYYFGFFDRIQNKEKDALRNVGRYPCNKKICKKPYVDVIQDPLVPPNSDEPHHAYNALLNRDPPVNHITQVKSILGGLKYYHHDHHHIHDYKCKKNETFFHGDGETWVGPDIDLFYSKKIDKKRFLRSGDDEEKKKRKGDKRFKAKISDRLHKENKKRLISLNNTFQMTGLYPVTKRSNKFKSRPMFLLTGALKPNPKQAEKKRPLFLLTGRHKGRTINQKPPLLLLTGRLNSHEEEHNKKNPLVLLTGRLSSKEVEHNKKNTLVLLTGRLNSNEVKQSKKNTLVLLTGRLNENNKSDRKQKIKNERHVSDENEKYYIIKKEQSGGRHDSQKTNKYPLPLFDYEFTDKKIARSKSTSESSESSFDYHDPDDIFLAESDTSKELNPEVVNLIIEVSQNSTDPRYQIKLISKLRKHGKLYTPAKKPKKVEYEELSPQLKRQGLLLRSGDKNMEAYVNVMKDMIRKDSKALKQYDWLSTTVDIRSALNKLFQLGKLLQDDTHNIHPKDLQIVKYMLYLFSTAQNLFDEEEKEVEIIPAASKSEESPKNVRFTYAARDSMERPKNLRFEYKDFKTINIRKRNGRRFEYRPWLRKDGVKEKMVVLNKFLYQLEQTLNGLHDAIKHIAIVTSYRSQRWFENLRQLYLTDPPSRKQALEIILHISLTRLISLIEESAANGLVSNYVRYGNDNPEQVERTKDEFAFVVKVYLALKKLQ